MTEIEIRNIDTAPGVRLSVSVTGQGPLVILMHGWPELSLSWRKQMGVLAEAGYTAAAPDMRGYGLSSRPTDPAAYSADALADDMAEVARSLGHDRWVAVGHDWGGPIAWRCALRFPDEVRGVFCLSVPYTPAPPYTVEQMSDLMFPDSFYYIRYFQEIGRPEAELDADPRAALKRIFFALSGDAPDNAWVAARPKDDPLLPGLPDAPVGPLSFMADVELDQYAALYRDSGFFGSLCWYRNIDRNTQQANAYGDQRVRQPAGLLTGDKEIVLTLSPGALDAQKVYCDDLRTVTILPGAGHWIQQERPAEVNAALIAFLSDIDHRP